MRRSLRLRKLRLATMLVALACGRPPSGEAAPAGATASRDVQSLRSRITLLRAAPTASSPAAAALCHLATARAAGAWGGDIADLEPAGVHDTGRGPIIARYRQRVAGLPVFRGEVAVVMTRELALAGLVGAPIPGGRAAGARGASRALPPPFRIGAAAAAQAAYADRGVSLASRPEPIAGAPELYAASGAGTRRPGGPARVRRVLFPAPGGLVAAYHVEVPVTGERRPESWSMVVSAEDRRVLFRHDRIRTASPFTYRVYAAEQGIPVASSPYCDAGIPHPTGLPDGYQPDAPCAQRLASLAALAGHAPWLADDATETSGPNVDAFYQQCPPGRPSDAEFVAALGDFRAPLSGPRTFDHPYAPRASGTDAWCWNDPPGAATDPQLRAKLVQAFYTANVLHDLMEEHGFDGAAGAFQESNHGRGGRDHDPVRIVLGQGTYAWPTPDGYPPAVYMGRSPGTAINRDMGLDLSVFGHEWFHVLSSRLVGDADGLANTQGGALAEGWSDFFGLLLTVRPGQNALPANQAWGGLYTVGAYSNTGYCYPSPCSPAAPGEDQSWYFGIRRYPFTADALRNPLSFRLIEDDVPLPSGIPQSSWQGRLDNAEGHNAGEIWATALWRAYRSLLVAHGFTEGRDRMLDDLVAGLKATPVDPTFTEARDALLAVVRASDPADEALFREAFASVGMGAGAVSPRRDSVELHGVRESFAADGPGLWATDLALDDAGSGDADGILDVGESGRLSLVLRNTGFVDLSNASVTVEVPSTQASPGTQTVSGIALARGADRVIEVPIALTGSATYADLPVTVRFADRAAGLAEQTAGAHFRVSYDVRRTSDLDDAAQEVTDRDWSITRQVWGCGGGYTSREHQWRRVPVPGGHAYAAPAPVCWYASNMSTGWLLAGAGPVAVTLGATVVPGVAWDVRGRAELRDLDGHSSSTSFRNHQEGDGTRQEVRLDLPAAPGPRWVQLVLEVDAGSSASPGAPDALTIDHVAFEGLAGHAFSAVHDDGAPGAWPPTAAFDAAVDERAVQFTDRSRAAGDPLATWAWQFGDGAVSSERHPTHRYALAGDYWATLTVVDGKGAQDSHVARIRAEAALEPGVAYDHAFSGTTLFRVDVPHPVRELRITVPSQEGELGILARHGQPLGEALADGDALSTWTVLTAPGTLELVVPYPETGVWHLAVVGSADDVSAALNGPIHEPGHGGGGGCATGTEAGALALAGLVLLALRRGMRLVSG